MAKGYRNRRKFEIEEAKAKDGTRAKASLKRWKCS